MATKLEPVRTADREAELKSIIDELERLNVEARDKDLWLRTRWNTASHTPWHLGESKVPAVGPHGLPLDHKQPVPHLWKWADIENYLTTVARLCPLELTERQSVLLTNPAFGAHGIKVTNTIRIAISMYKPGDDATLHLHTPNASRTILSETGGYTVVEGERIPTARGDLVFTPNGTWHRHGNDDTTPVIWADILDWPLIDFLGGAEVRNDLENAPNIAPEQGFSQDFYGGAGMRPLFEPFGRGTGQATTKVFHIKGPDIRARLDLLKRYDGSPYHGVNVEFVDPISGQPPFPTLTYRASLLRPGEETLPFRHKASDTYCCIEGSGYTEIDGKRFAWGKNDFLVVPGYSWRKHVNTGKGDAVLYLVGDEPTYRKLGHYRAQGRDKRGNLVEL
jgi:gentisate 1,2-dioxygenase